MRCQDESRRRDTSSSYWRVAVVEDHLLQRHRTEELLGSQAGLTVVRSFETAPQLMRWLVTTKPGTRPHLVVLDLMVERGPSVMPEQVELLIQSGIRVLVLSALSSPSLVREVLRVGVHSVVSKRDGEDDIVAAVWATLGRGGWMTPELANVIAGTPARPVLSDQEERTLVLYASGRTMDAVAAAIGVRPGTAKKYLARVKEKYAAAGRPVRTKIDLSREAARDGLLNNDR